MRFIDNLCVVLAFVSGLILIAIIGLTFCDVILRYLFSAPIFGARDVLEMGMVVVISLSFPFSWRIGGHIVVDLLPDYDNPALTILRDVVVRLIGIFLFVVLAWQSWIRADDAVLFNEATNMIEIPFSPFFIVLAVGSAFQVIVLGVECARLLAGASLAHDIELMNGLEDLPSE